MRNSSGTSHISIECVVCNSVYVHPCVCTSKGLRLTLDVFLCCSSPCLFFLLNGVSHWTWIQLDWQLGTPLDSSRPDYRLLSPHPVCNIGVLGILTQAVMFGQKDSKRFTDQVMTRKFLLVCGLQTQMNCFYLTHRFLVEWMMRTQAVRSC